MHYELCIMNYLLIRHPLPIPYLHHAAEGESEVADEVAHRDVVVVGVDAEPLHALGSCLPFRELENVLGEVETEKLVGNGETVHDNVGLAVAEPFPVNFFVIGVFVKHDGGVGGRFHTFAEIMPLVFPLVVAYGLFVWIAVLPLVEVAFLHPALRLPDDFHDVIDVIKFRVEMLGPTGGEEDFGGLLIFDKGIDELSLVPEFFLLRYLVNRLERNFFAVESGAGVDDVDFVGEFVQIERRARAHVEHPLVALPIVSDPCGVSSLLQRDGRVGLHVGGREPELVSVSESLDDSSGDVVGEVHGGFRIQVSSSSSKFKVQGSRLI